MLTPKDWLRFALNSETSSTETFEEQFCTRFFALHNDFDEKDVVIIKQLAGIEIMPVNGVAFQSKFLNQWDWTPIRESLEKVFNNKEKLYPKLTKVIVYAKDILPKYLEDKNDKVKGIIPKLKDIGIEVEFFSGFEVIFEEQKYEKLRDFFKLPTDKAGELLLVKKYLDKLRIEDAKELLDIIENKFDDLDNEQRYNFYIQKGNYERLFHLFIDNTKHNDFSKNYIEAFKYKTDKKALINKAIGLFYLNDKKGAKEIIEKILSENDFEEIAYRFYIDIKYDELKSYEEILKLCDSKYLNSPDVQKSIGRTAFLDKNYEKAYEWFMKGYEGSSDNKLEDKLFLVMVWSSKLNDSFNIFNLSLETKKEYLEFLELLDEVEHEVIGLEYYEIAGNFNLQALIYGNIVKDIDKSIQYFDIALKIKDDDVFKFNKANTLLTFGDESKAIKLFEELYLDYDKLIESNKTNLQNHILYQIPLILAQYYNYNKDPKLAITILEKFKGDYYPILDEFTQRNLNTILINTYANNSETLEKAKESIVEHIVSNPEILVYYVIAFTVFKDKKYLDEAYKLYKSGKGKFVDHDILQMAEILYTNDKKEESFELLESNLRDLSQDRYSDLFIGIGIQLGKVDEVIKIIAKYELHIGGENEYSIYHKVNLYDKMGDSQKALEILEDSKLKDSIPSLLLFRAYLYEKLSEEDKLKELLRFILSNFNIVQTFTFENIIHLIHHLQLHLPDEALELIYYLIQTEQKKEFLSKYESELIRLNFNYTEIPIKYSSDSIDENSVVELKDSVGKKQLYLLDGFSKRIGGIVDVFSKNDYSFNKLIGRNIGDRIIDLYPSNIKGFTSEFEITNFYSKYIFLIQSLLMEIERLGIGKLIAVPEGNEIETMTNLMKVIAPSRKDTVDMLKKDFYNKGLLSFGIISELLHCSYYDAYNFSLYGNDFNLISDSTFKLDSTKDEVSALIDFSAILTIHKLGVEEITGKNLKLFITQSTIDDIKIELLNAKTDLNHKSGTVLLNDHGKLGYIDNSVNSKEEKIRLLENILEWIGKYTKIKSGKTLLIKRKTEVLGKMTEDLLKIASEHKLNIFSDDGTIRMLFRCPDYQGKAFGTEILIGILFAKRLITIENHFELFMKLMNFNFLNLRFTTDLVGYYLFKSQLNDSINLDKIFSYCRRNGVDLTFVIASIFESLDKLIQLGGVKISYANFKYLVDIIIKHYSLDEVMEGCLNRLTTLDSQRLLIYAKLIDKYLIDSKTSFN